MTSSTSPTQPTADAKVELPTEAMWDGLARDIMMWLDMTPKTPRALFKHLERTGREIPDWLRNEPEMQALDHVPSRAADGVIGDCYAHQLYCARIRKMRPQGACYKTIEPQFWPLFDAAGEPREADRAAFGNPVSQASAIEARSDAPPKSGAAEGESAGPKDDAHA
jgi:hypothetical protein